MLVPVPWQVSQHITELLLEKVEENSTQILTTLYKMLERYRVIMLLYLSTGSVWSRVSNF